MNNEKEIELSRPHHPFSPSSLQSREACPCYEGAQNETEASFYGTLQHNAVDSGSDDLRLSDARATAVADCIRFAEGRAALYPGGTVIREAYLPVDDCAYLIEVHTVEQFDIVTTDGDGAGQVSPGFRGATRYEIIEATTAGYLDFAVVSADETEAEIWDWKFGKFIVTHARDNVQGISYMLGLKRRFPKLRRVKVGFIQPHADDESEHTFDLDVVQTELYLRIKCIVTRSIEVRQRGMDWSQARVNVGACSFCANIGRCPAVAAVAIKVGKKYRPAEIPDNLTPSLIMDPAQVGHGIKLAQIVKTWAESFRAQATQKTIEDMEFVPDGYKLVQCDGRTKIEDVSGVEDIAKLFLPEEHHHLIAKLRDIPLGKLDELIQTVTPRGQKEARVQEFRDALAEKGATTRGNPYAILRMAQVKESKPE